MHRHGAVGGRWPRTALLAVVIALCVGCVWGSLSYGGALVTGGGLVFIAATRDAMLRAFDVETGTLLWSGALPAGAPATPMT